MKDKIVHRLTTTIVVGVLTTKHLDETTEFTFHTDPCSRWACYFKLHRERIALLLSAYENQIAYEEERQYWY